MEYQEPIKFDTTMSENGVERNSDYTFTLKPAKYWRIDFGVQAYSTSGIAEFLFILNGGQVATMPIPSSSGQNHYSFSFIVPAKENSVLKILGTGHPIDLDPHQPNAWLTIQAIADL